MDKRGDILNQLAIISDLIEKLNLQSKTSTLIIELEKSEFERVFEYFNKKYDRRTDLPENTFTIKLGVVDIVFNTSSV